MNTILHLAGVLSALWASLFAFETLSEPALGGALLILFFGFAVMTLAAIDDDLFLITGRKLLGFRGDQREAISMSSKLAATITILLLFLSTINVTGVSIGNGITLFAPAANAASTTTSTPSGLEFIDGELTNLQGCADGENLAWGEAADEWACTTAAGGGVSVALDLGDNASNESDALTKIATSGDTNSIFTESAADKLLIAVASNWPTSDTADALSADPRNCASNEASAGITAAGVAEGCRRLNSDGLTISVTGALSSTLGTFIITTEILDGTILPVDLDTVDAPADEECLEYESDTANFSWETCAAGDADQNLFETFTDTVTNIVADSTTDTLTIAVSGNAINTIFDDTLDTITFEVDPAVLFDERTAMFVQTGDVDLALDIENIRIYNTFGVTGTIQDVSCWVDTAPTTSAITVDVNKGGTTIFSGDQPSITAGNFFDTGIPSVTSFAAGDYLQIEMDAVDSGDTGADLTCGVRIRFRIYDSTS